MTTLEQQFIAFSKLGDTRSCGMTINLTQSDKWMKQARIISSKITTADTAVCFNKFKKKSLNFKEYELFIKELAKRKNIEVEFIINKLVSCGSPSLLNTTQPNENETVRRLTNPANFTGCHRERFCVGLKRGISKERNIPNSDDEN